jgi:hypothetical protein
MAEPTFQVWLLLLLLILVLILFLLFLLIFFVFSLLAVPLPQNLGNPHSPRNGWNPSYLYHPQIAFHPFSSSFSIAVLIPIFR